MTFQDVDLTSFRDFPPQQGAYEIPRLTMNARGQLIMNTAMKKLVGAEREFWGRLSRDGTQLLLEGGRTNIRFSQSTCTARHRALLEELRELGFSLPVSYRMERCEEEGFWLGRCEEIASAPPVEVDGAVSRTRRAK